MNLKNNKLTVYLNNPLRKLSRLLLKLFKICIFFSLNKRKKYKFLKINNKKSNIYIKNTLVNTYLSMSIDRNIVYAKSSGIIGIRKKQRRMKNSAYKLGKDLSLALNNFLINDKIKSIYLNLLGQRRYYRAVMSNIRKVMRKAMKLKRSSIKSSFWHLKLKEWKFKKRILKLNFKKFKLKKKFKLTKQQLTYEKYLELKIRKSVVLFLFFRKIYDKFSVPHGGLKRSKYLKNDRYY